MPKFTLISEHDDYSRSTLEFEADSLSVVLENFDRFLRGTGFFYDGVLTIENEESGDTHKSFENEDAISLDNMYNAFGEQSDTISLFSENKCELCGLTFSQLGNYRCYDPGCPKSETFTISGKL